MDAYQILRSYDRNSVLGELTDRSANQLDRFFRQEHRGLKQALGEARQQAQQEEREIALDASRLSGVNGGDILTVDPSGRVSRKLEAFPEVARQLTGESEPIEGLRPCGSLERARPLLARCAYNGLWSPSGTNWQPIRTVELSPEEVALFSGGDDGQRLRPVPGERAEGVAGGCGLLVLARRSYDSILGDIARLCRIDLNCHAEEIDLGIWLLAAEQTARGHGWWLQRRVIPAGSRALYADMVQQTIRERISRLPAAEQEARAAAERLLTSLQAGDHLPCCLLVAWEGRELELDESQCGSLRPSAFDRLVEARSTQRVASPAGELESDLLIDLFEGARRFARGASSGSAVDAIRFPVFCWHDGFPEQVGQAMHQGVQGPDGLLSRANRENALAFLGLPPGDQQEPAASDGTVLPAGAIPQHILAKLLDGNLFRRQEDAIVDRRGKPMTLSLFLNLLRMMLSSFVRFSLGFRNTHPLLGVLLAPPAPPAEGGEQAGDSVFQAMGTAVEHMSLMARARGYVSIIKSGPTEIAGDAICELVSRHAVEQEIREQTASGELHPVLTFQAGLPLGPDERVCSGQPEEHDGLQERLLDRRATRAPLLRHYLPA